MKKFFLVLVFCLNLFGQTNFWTHHSLDFKINSLHKSVSGTFYAASDTSILKSNDYGISWDVVYTTPHPCDNWTRLLLFINKNHFPQDKLVVRQRNGSTACIDVPPIISLNGGDNWSEFNAPGFIIDLAINSFGNIYVVSNTNLYITTNDGNNWQTVSIPAEDESILTVDIDTLNTLYISKWGMLNVPPNPILSWNNIYRSTNYGQNWEFILTSGIGLAYGYSSIFNIPKGDLFASVSGPTETHHYFNGTLKAYPLLGVSSAHITAQ